MEMKSVGAGRGWSWLVFGLKSGFKQPKTLFGAAALFLLVAFAVGAVQMIAMVLLRQSLTAMLALYAVGMVVGVLVYPLLVGGYLRVQDAVEKGRPVSATAIFSPFSAGGGAGRLILVSLGLLLIYLVVMVLVYFTVGHAVGNWYLQVMEMGLHAADKPPPLPPMPGGFAATGAILMLFFIFYSAAFAIAMGQAAMRQCPPLQALRDGMVGAVKNLLPLLILALCSLLALIVISLGMGLVVLIITMIVSQLGPTFSLILIMPLYALMLLFMYQVMIGVMYAIWQDVADGGESDAAMPPPPPAQVEA